MNELVNIVCPSCGKKLRARQKDNGKVYVICSGCKTKINSYMHFRGMRRVVEIKTICNKE